MMHERNSLTLTRAELRALLAHASHDEARRHLTAIHFEPGACPPRVFATDGHRLLVGACQGPDRVGDPLPSVSLPRETLDSALRLTRGSGSVVRITFGPPQIVGQGPNDAPRLTAPGHASIEVFDSLVAVDCARPVGGFFCRIDPDVKAPPIDHLLASVAPDRAYGERSPFVAFNPSYLADLKLVLSAAADTGAKEGVQLFTPREPLDPVYFESGLWRGLLMPLKMGEQPKRDEKRASEPRTDATADAIDGAAPDALPAKGNGKRKGKRKGKPDLHVVNG